jgi:hypothetical protein
VEFPSLSWTVCGYRRVALLKRIEHPANIAGDYRADIYRTAAPELMGFRKDGLGINAWGVTPGKIAIKMLK